MGNIEFRTAGVESVAELVHLWKKTFAEAYEGVHSPENIQALCSESFTKSNARKVLTSDREDFQKWLDEEHEYLGLDE